jgi:DNA-binding MarR family transcriptional regulator
MKEPEPQPADLMELLRQRVSVIARDELRNLTLRQFAVLLVCYSADEPQTVRGLAQHLQTHRPAITRATDRLVDEGFVARKADSADRRSVLITATPAGMQYCVEFFGKGPRITSARSGDPEPS